jgi:hypothetical protein
MKLIHSSWFRLLLLLLLLPMPPMITCCPLHDFTDALQVLALQRWR